MKPAMRAYVRQKDRSDCGVCCLATIIRYFGGIADLERLRELSGTSPQGTTLLGLQQAAVASGFNAIGYKSTVSVLKQIDSPAIIHITQDGYNHYVALLGYVNNQLLIADPATGVAKWPVSRLERQWSSRSLLVVQPTPGFRRAKPVRQTQKRWVVRFMTKNMSMLLFATAIGLLVSIMSVSTALFSQVLLDRILPSNDTVRLWTGLGLLVGVLIFRGVLAVIRNILLLKYAYSFNVRLIRYFYGTLLRLPVPFFQSRRLGDLVARMNDTTRIQHAISYLWGGAFVDACLVLTVLAFLSVYSGVVAVIAIALLSCLGLTVWMFHQPLSDRHKAVMVAYAANESNYVDTIRGIVDIKAGKAEDNVAASTLAIYRDLQQRSLALGQVGTWFGFCCELVGIGLIGVVTALGATMVLDRQITVGQMTAMIQMIGFVVPSAVSLAMTNIRLQEARVALDRMFDLTMLDLDTETDRAPHREPPTTIRSIAVKELSFGYPGRRLLLRDVDVSVSRGELITLFGETGSGKTTVLSLLQRFHLPAQGAILVNGKPWTHVSTAEWRQLVGVVPQHPQLFTGNLVSNICLGDAKSDVEKVRSFCEEVGLDSFCRSLPQGYGTSVGEGGVVLSGGQRQLVALARALYQRPQVLLLDEVTAGMDRQTEDLVTSILVGLRSKMCTVCVTHQLWMAMRTDRIYVIRHGVVEDRGVHEELIERKNLYSESWERLTARR